jgi:hypothetical protein
VLSCGEVIVRLPLGWLTVGFAVVFSGCFNPVAVVLVVICSVVVMDVVVDRTAGVFLQPTNRTAPIIKIRKYLPGFFIYVFIP